MVTFAEGTPAPSDFFRSNEGTVGLYPRFWTRRRVARWADTAFDFCLQSNPTFRRLAQQALQSPAEEVLIVGVEVPARKQDLQDLFARCQESHHHVTCLAAPLQKGRGKFQNINDALANVDLHRYKWLVVVDDDVDVPRHFLDLLLYFSEAADLKISMPAHRLRSYQTFRIAQRRWNALARRTRFVECGPVTVFHRDVFSWCVPFADLRWAWGTDVVWSDVAWKKDVSIGVVDACPLRHLRPVFGSYSEAEARAEGESYLQQQGVSRSRAEFLREDTRVPVSTSAYRPAGQS